MYLYRSRNLKYKGTSKCNANLLEIIGVNKNPVDQYNISLKCDLLSLNIITDH